MEVTFKIRRYNPEDPEHKKPYWQSFTLKDVIETDRVLELLHRIKWEQDGTLAFRRSCSHGICGSDAMRINGKNALACKLLIRDVGERVQVEPILGLPVLKDMIVDMEPFFAHYRSVMPYFVNNSPVPADGRERLQSAQDRAVFDDTTNCILCAACTTSCPSFWANGEYVGPAAIVQAHRFIFDSRDEVFVTHDQEEALEVSDRVVIMNEGRVEQSGTPEEVYDRPATPFVYGFLGDVNLFHGRISRGLVKVGETELEAPPEWADAGDQDAVAYVRTYDVELTPSSNGRSSIEAIVRHIRAFGPVVRLELDRVDDGSSIEAHLPRAHYEQLAVGKGQRVFVSPTSVAVFPQSVGGKSARSA
jgi:succinate dehydrogenase / fumarate reductase iron-sulfur subunit